MGHDSVGSSGCGSCQVRSVGEEISEPVPESRDPERGSSTDANSENMSLLARGAELLIRGYQFISRHTPAVCKFRPTCSEYTRQAIVRYGFWKGCAMGAWRILRCNPFSRGGYDPVP